jgi:NIPSNAP
MFFELRQYRTKPGQRENWVKLFEEVIVPFQVSKGMVISGSFVGQEEEDLFIWIRRFESEEERVELYKAVYETDYWKNEVAPKVGGMLDRPRMVITRIEATPKSVIR